MKQKDSMTNYTPGPWREGQEGNWRVYGPDGQGEHSGLIAVVHKARANACLIAAAPDLLEALEQMLAAHNIDAPECVFARAAIAKAKGQA